MESKNIIGCHWSTQFICLHFVQITTHNILSAQAGAGLLPQRKQPQQFFLVFTGFYHGVVAVFSEKILIKKK